MKTAQPQENVSQRWESSRLHLTPIRNGIAAVVYPHRLCSTRTYPLGVLNDTLRDRAQVRPEFLGWKNHPIRIMKSIGARRLTTAICKSVIEFRPTLFILLPSGIHRTLPVGSNTDQNQC